MLCAKLVSVPNSGLLCTRLYTESGENESGWKSRVPSSFLLTHFEIAASLECNVNFPFPGSTFTMSFCAVGQSVRCGVVISLEDTTKRGCIILTNKNVSLRSKLCH